VPFVPTPHKHIDTILTSLALQPGDVVYELGSGDGRVVLAAAQKNPSVIFLGIERNPILYLYSKLNYRFCGSPKNLSYQRANFFALDFAKPSKLYGYLLPEVMDALLPLLSTFRGRFASRAFRFSDKQPVDIVELTAKTGSHGEHLLYIYDF